jgi:FtsP/CotA-like multicopper oxidase with cupredoxin domain
MHRIGRRRFLRASIGTSLLLSQAERSRATTPGLVEVSLEAGRAAVEAGGRIAWLYAYNGQVPGPVIEARAGDEVAVAFRNGLPEVTNLHFHGLHVPSTGNADNVMLRIPPGESMEYRFRIPDDHPSGTFWYHPHVHGSAARQVAQGLAGAFIVRNDKDTPPEVGRAPESVLVLQDFDLDARGWPLEPNTMERMMGREGALVTVSGRREPDLLIQQGGWLRLRVVNASSSRFYRLRLDEHTFFQVGTDGGLLGRVEPKDEVLLSPGERAELMVRGDREPGAYRLRSLPYNRGGMAMMGFGGGSVEVVLGWLRYDGVADSQWDLPETLAPVEQVPSPSILRRFLLGQGMGMGMMGGGMSFTINGRTFNENRIDVRSVVGGVEEWEFVNATAMDHPMHIHTNPFQIVDAEGNARPAWKDTVLVRAASRVRVRTVFRDFAGTSMYHCHILDHEDMGMMGVLEIALPTV